MSQRHPDLKIPLSDLTLTKAEFAVLLSMVVGEPFVLDRRARRELNLSRGALAQAEADLVARGLIGSDGGASSPLADVLSMFLSPGWKVIVQLQSRRPEWVQLALHLGAEVLVGEGLKQDESRLLTEFDTLPQAVEWLVSRTTGETSAIASDTRPLESLLPSAETIANLLGVDTAADEAHVSALWVQAEGRLWFLTASSAEQATALTQDNLQRQLVKLLESALPPELLKKE